MDIQNRVFIVTGAASGLGLATAGMIVENGGYVLLADVNAADGVGRPRRHSGNFLLQIY